MERGNARPRAVARPDWTAGMNASTKAAMAQHDAWVATLAQETVLLAARDLCRQPASNRADPAERWKMDRKAALLRRISRERLVA